MQEALYFFLRIRKGNPKKIASNGATGSKNKRNCAILGDETDGFKTANLGVFGALDGCAVCAVSFGERLHKNEKLLRRVA